MTEPSEKEKIILEKIEKLKAEIVKEEKMAEDMRQFDHNMPDTCADVIGHCKGEIARCQEEIRQLEADLEAERQAP